MKLNYQTSRNLFCLTLPVFVLLTGCDNGSKISDSAGASNSTNLVGSASSNVDNSGINTRDRDGANLTPGDQGNSDADRAITQKIRQALVNGTNYAGATNDYSVTAKNVKIITADGKVTLRGPVNTPDEKAGIDSIAKNVAGDANVDDQLEVKANQ
jgi:hyperosmotically inducible protein